MRACHHNDGGQASLQGCLRHRADEGLSPPVKQLLGLAEALRFTRCQDDSSDRFMDGMDLFILQTGDDHGLISREQGFDHGSRLGLQFRRICLVEQGNPPGCWRDIFQAAFRVGQYAHKRFCRNDFTSLQFAQASKDFRPVNIFFI